jgi:hypothetical protein
MYLFFKCTVLQTTDALATEFVVKKVRTIIFYWNNVKREHLEKPTEDLLIQKLNEHCKKLERTEDQRLNKSVQPDKQSNS